MFKKGMVFCLISLLTACGLSPKPLSVNERYTDANNDLRQMFANEPKQPKKLDYYQALARSAQYNLDYRIKLVNTALQAGQLDIAALTLLPSLNSSGSLYTRNNALNTSGITADGISTGLSSSTPKTLRTARVALSWNLLDFGMGYVRAKQQGNRILIAEEESRRQLQQLSQDVLVAYWNAYSAQQLIGDTKQFQALLTQAKNKLAKAQLDSNVPKESILNYQAALLEGDRRLIQLKYKYNKAMSDLKHLLFLPLDQTYILAPPPQSFFHAQSLNDLNFDKVDAVTLVAHPQLRGEHYQQRIAELGVKTVILQALPGINFNYGWNYTSNQFVQNTIWLDRSMDIAWNLLNLASLPTSYRTAKLQVKYEQFKQMALTMAALTETRYAFSHYETLREEYLIAHKQTENSQALFILNRDRKLASLASDQQVILAKLRTITSKMDENLLLSDLSVALGELYLSVGADILPEDLITKPYPEAVEDLRQHFVLNNQQNFKKFINDSYYDFFEKNLTPPPPPKKVVYTVQLSGSYHLKNIKTEQQKLKTTAPLAIGKTQHHGHDWYVLTYGKFHDLQQAKLDKKNLPPKILSPNSWIRKTDDLTWLS